MLRNRKVAEGTPAPWFLTGHVTVRVSPPWLSAPTTQHCQPGLLGKLDGEGRLLLLTPIGSSQFLKSHLCLACMSLAQI